MRLGRSGRRWLSVRWLALGLLSWACAPGVPDSETSLHFDVDLDRVIHTMRGGIGASWHAIDQPLPRVRGKSHAGSAWGGNPPASDDVGWAQLEAHADWLGLSWSRVELSQRMYEPERGEFDWDNPEMRILYRILDWCQSRGVDVLLAQMWGNVAWNTFPEWRDDEVKRIHSGPASMADFAEGLAELVEHLVRRKGYTSIRWLSIVNEPGYNWSWWRQPIVGCMKLAPGLAAVRAALDARGLDLPLAAPGWTNLPVLKPGRIDFDPLIGAYALHSYQTNFDGRRGGLPLIEAERRISSWVEWAHERGKPFFLSEIGSMVFGWRGNDPGPGSFDAGLKDAELVVRGLNLGVDAFNRWSFVNRGDLDGQWQLVDTWDVAADRLRSELTPHPNSYFLFGLISRFSARGSDVLGLSVSGDVTTPRHVFVAALRSPRGELTLLVVNDGERDSPVSFALRGLGSRAELRRYRVTGEERDRVDLRIGPQRLFTLTPDQTGFEDVVPGLSVSVYSTYELGHQDPGVISE